MAETKKSESEEAVRKLANALYEALKSDDPTNFVTAMDDDGEVTLDGQFNLFRIASSLRGSALNLSRV